MLDVVQNQSGGGLRNGEQSENLRLSFSGAATVGADERERSFFYVGRPGLDPGTLGLKDHRVHYSLFIRFREPHIHRGLRSVRSVAIEKC